MLCMWMNLGGDQSRDSAAGVRVQVESGAFTFLESENSGARDHRRIVGRQSRRWREHSDAFRVQLGAHRSGQSSIAGDAAAEHNPTAAKGARRTLSLFDQCVDQ